ncbi:MAG: Na/Pi cotransporter family protein [Pseudomonadota bacterium]
MVALLQFAGTVALLIWSLKLIQKGVLNGFGNQLRVFAKSNDGRTIPALLSGVSIAGISQSSTATALLASTLVDQRVLGSATALFVVLGADVGTAGAAFFASVYKGTLLQSILLFAGVALLLRCSTTKARSVGQVMIGIGLLLTAIATLNSGADRWSESEHLQVVLGLMENMQLVLVLLAALITYALFSSLAVILLVVQSQVAGIVDAQAALLLVVGANIGGGLLPVLTRLGSDKLVMAPLVANFGLRSLMGLVFILAADPIIAQIMSISSAVTFAVLVHLCLNVLVVILGMLFGRMILDWLSQLEWGNDADQSRRGISSLIESALDRPEEGLACAKREALRMTDTVEQMLARTGNSLLEPSIDDREIVRSLEAEVDDIYVSTKHYIAQLAQTPLTPTQSDRVIELLNFIANMEHIGDIIDAGLSETTHNQAKYAIEFSKEGHREIAELHILVCENFQLAINAFVASNGNLARQLVDRKSSVRDLIEKSSSTHLSRLGNGDPRTVQSTSLHLDVLRDLSRINSHLVATAYPILNAAGHVRKTKWTTAKDKSKPKLRRSSSEGMATIAQ